MYNHSFYILARDYMCGALGPLGIGNLGVERRGGPAPPFICQIIIAELVTLPALNSPRILKTHLHHKTNRRTCDLFSSREQ